MVEYKHGIAIQENPTSIPQPVESLSAVQVVFGTAPINLSDAPNEVTNKPFLVRSWDEAKKKLGYSDSWDQFTLCEVMDASFKQFKVGPIVFVNVLDPEIHNEAVNNLTVPILNKAAVIKQEGILLDSLVVTSNDGQTTYVKNSDYMVAFNQEGYPLISVLSTGSISSSTTDIQVSFSKLKPSAVTNLDLIGGYDSATNSYKGFELIKTIFPTLNVVPNILLAPGFTQHAVVGALLVAKANKINGCFNAKVLLDVKGETKEQAYQNKVDNDYNDKSSTVCWPKAKIRNKTYRFSTIVAATMARTDVENDNVPYKSPSNKRIPITAMVNDLGKEVFLDQIEGNVLNGYGIMTAINMNGWRTWGNNTAAYDPDFVGVMDPKDRFIAVRRMFDWWGNTFILNYFDKVDDPTNFRLIESVVDSENIRANGFQARGQMAGAHIEFRQEDNPVSQILDGKIKFIQKVAFYTPAEVIENVLEFDPTILTDAIFGGE